ncbi:MAG: hemolysin family protein [Lachnospirales bacterium]
MDDGYSPINMAILLAFVALSAVLYGFGAAIQHVNEAKLEEEKEKGDAKAEKLLWAAGHPQRFIATVLLITSIMGMAAGLMIWKGLAVWLGTFLKVRFSIEGAWILPVCMIASVIVLLLVFIPFGIVIPKELAVKNPEKWAEKLLPLIDILMKICLPMTGLINGVSWLILKLMGLDMKKDIDNVTEEDIRSMVNEGHEQGILEAGEAEMITNIFELDDKTAEDVMTHRKSLVALDGALTLREALDFILKEGKNSRYPVYREEIDDIIGILHMRDAVVFFEKDDYKDMPLAEIPQLLREAHFIPETRSLDNLFREMQSQKIHMEIVVDEYGQTVGIVTMEDILEEIVGNIMDEYDVEENFITAEDSGSFLMNGMTPLEQAEEVLGVTFEKEDEELYDTINGFLISKLGRIPGEGENPVVSCLGYEFQILNVENKTIRLVRAVLQDKKGGC